MAFVLVVLLGSSASDARAQELEQAVTSPTEGVAETSTELIETVEETGGEVVREVEHTGTGLVEDVQETSISVVRTIEDTSTEAVETVEQTGDELIREVEHTGTGLVEDVEETAGALDVDAGTGDGALVDHTPGTDRPEPPAPTLSTSRSAPPPEPSSGLPGSPSSPITTPRPEGRALDAGPGPGGAPARLPHPPEPDRRSPPFDHTPPLPERSPLGPPTQSGGAFGGDLPSVLPAGVTLEPPVTRRLRPRPRGPPSSRRSISEAEPG